MQTKLIFTATKMPTKQQNVISHENFYGKMHAVYKCGGLITKYFKQIALQDISLPYGIALDLY